MGATVTLEDELERRGTARASKDEVAKDLWPRYCSMKGYLDDAYYRFIQANCPWYTDHGARHIKSVIETASRLMSKQLGMNKGDGSDLSSLELFLTLSAILWHDVGNVVKRSGHAEQIPEMAEKIKGVFPNVAIRRVVEEIARAHSGTAGLKIPRVDEDCALQHRTIAVYPRSLAALVRFADEVSENQTRISTELLPHVPPESKIFWEYANCITAAVPDIARERVVITFDIPADKIAAKFSCAEFPRRSDENGKISLIEYIVCRLEKMNNERAYCLPYMRYGSIRNILARFTVLKDTWRLPSHDGMEITFGDSGINADGYPEIEIFEPFFQHRANWSPASLVEATTP